MATVFGAFSVHTPADSPSNVLGLEYGWLPWYSGYHVRD